MNNSKIRTKILIATYVIVLLIAYLAGELPWIFLELSTFLTGKTLKLIKITLNNI